MTWFNDLGFARNPLSIKPTDDSGLVGYEKIIQRMIYQIKIGNVIFLQGEYGSGKSSIMKLLRREFGDNVLYHDCSSRRNLKASIMEARQLWRKILFLKPNRLILLLDEAHLSEPKDFDFLYEYYIMDVVKSVIFAGTDFNMVHFNKAFKSDTKIYELNDIRNNLASEILNKRMPGQKLISPQLARRAFMLSDSNPRTFLENQEDIFRRVVGMGRVRVARRDIEEFFEKKTVSLASRDSEREQHISF